MDVPSPRRFAGRMLFACLLAVVPVARAQETAPDTSRVVYLEPVVVTALRTPFLLPDVPYAVAIHGLAEIQRARPGLGLDEALSGIPGVQVDNRYNYALGERIAIRGFGARAAFGVRGVRVLLDGIPATMPDGQTVLNHIDLGAIGRVEVVRGPASALYGNAAGGVIQFESERPPPVPFGQTFSVTGGAHGLLRLSSETGGRSGRAAYQLNLSHLSYGGYRDHSDAENVHATARITYDDAWLLSGSFVNYDARNPGSLSDSLLRADRSQAYRFNAVQQTGEEGRQGQLGLRWRRALRGGQLEVAGYGLARRIDNPIPPTVIDLSRRAGGLRALFRSHPSPPLAGLQWSAGAELDTQRDERRNYVNERGERGTLTLDQLERVRAAAAFVQLAAAPAPRLSVLGGLRYDHVRFSADDRLVHTTEPDDSGHRTLDAFSPSLGLTYQATEAIHLYGNVSTAFETPTTTELANRPSGAGGFNPALEPQRTRSVEGGLRGQLHDRVAYQLAAYYAAVEDALIPFEVPDAPGRQFFRNAGSAVHRGVEAGLDGLLYGGFRLRVAYTFTDARFDAYVVEGVSFEGNRLPGVAPHRLEASLSYQGPRGWFGVLDLRHAAEMATDDANAAFSPAYTVADARAGIERIDLGFGRVAAFAGVTNLFDARYNTSVTVNAFGGRYYEPGPGRALYVGASFGFDAGGEAER